MFCTAVVFLMCACACYAQPESEYLEPVEWVAVSRCRLSCVNKFLVSAGSDLTEEACMGDAQGCFMCWKMCEYLKTDPGTFADACDPGSTHLTCSAGCRAACDVHDQLDKRFYDPDNAALIAPPLIDAYNASAVLFTSRDESYVIVIYVIMYRLDENSRWRQLLSTYQQPIPVYGSFASYPSLQVRMLTVTSRGVIGDAILDLYSLASETAEFKPPATAITPPSLTATHDSKPNSKHLEPEESLQPVREFNHNLGADGSEGLLYPPPHAKNDGQHTRISIYVAIAVVVVLVVSVIVVGILIVQSNTKLVKSLAQDSTSFRGGLAHVARCEGKENEDQRPPRRDHVMQGCGRDVEAGEAFLCEGQRSSRGVHVMQAYSRDAEANQAFLCEGQRLARGDHVIRGCHRELETDEVFIDNAPRKPDGMPLLWMSPSTLHAVDLSSFNLHAASCSRGDTQYLSAHSPAPSNEKALAPGDDVNASLRPMSPTRFMNLTIEKARTGDIESDQTAKTADTPCLETVGAGDMACVETTGTEVVACVETVDTENTVCGQSTGVCSDMVCTQTNLDYRVMAVQTGHCMESDLALLDVSSLCDNETSDVTSTSSGSSAQPQPRMGRRVTISSANSDI